MGCHLVLLSVFWYGYVNLSCVFSFFLWFFLAKTSKMSSFAVHLAALEEALIWASGCIFINLPIICQGETLGWHSVAQHKLFVTASVIYSRNFLSMKCQNQGFNVAVFWKGHLREWKNPDSIVLQVLHFNNFLLSIWKRLSVSKDYMTIKCLVCPYAFLFWLHLLFFLLSKSLCRYFAMPNYQASKCAKQ